VTKCQRPSFLAEEWRAHQYITGMDTKCRSGISARAPCEDGPVHGFFIRRVLSEFFNTPFDTPGDEFKFTGGTLSPASLLRLQSSIRRVAAEFEQLARQDVRLPLEERDSCTVILAMSSWEFSEFSNLRRTPRRQNEKSRPQTIRAK
jgi:hypothetical protein